MRNYQWYSLCSAHREIDPQCAACHAGKWVDENDPDVIADRQLYADDPAEWIREHNERKTAFVMNFEAGRYMGQVTAWTTGEAELEIADTIAGTVYRSHHDLAERKGQR